MNHVEELSKIKVLRTCEELARHGISTDGLYTIDPDGEMIGYNPIEVYCAFDVDGNVVTEVKHFQDNVIQAQKCETPRCFNKTIEYGVPLVQIEAKICLTRDTIRRIDIVSRCFENKKRIIVVKQNL